MRGSGPVERRCGEPGVVADEVNRCRGEEVRVLGLDPRRTRRALRPRVGITLQDSGFATELTVVEMLTLWRSLRSRPGDVDVALKRVEVQLRGKPTVDLCYKCVL